MTDARDLLVARASSSEIPRVRPGASSYFTAPTADLDPALFGMGETLLPYVREWILSTLSRFWHDRYHEGSKWSTVWLAGSGITYQWSAARSPGDLDVLVGVDFEGFRQTNSEYAGFTDVDAGALMNEGFRELDQHTAATDFGLGSVYEVTFYVNVTAPDIRFIHPYAAYDVTHDTWTVRPPDLGPDWNPETHFPASWWAKIREEQVQATELLKSYARLVHLLKQRRLTPPAAINTATQLQQLVARGAAMFNEIHLSRRNAFSMDGNGYMDWYNFRWQAHKRNGVVPALHALANLDAEARQAGERELYGAPLTDSATALRTAATVHSILDSVRA